MRGPRVSAFGARGPDAASYAMIDPYRLAIRWLLASSLLLGLAQISVLPPWEGFDETAHYSYVAQLATLGTWPGFGDPLYKPVEDYVAIAPTPYASVTPFDVNEGWTYDTFFNGPPSTIAAADRAINAPRHEGPAWEAGKRANWEAQHPPVFYALLAPVFEVTAAWTLAHQLFVLRTISFLFAWASLCVGVASSASVGSAMGGGRDVGRWIALGAVLWPFLFPGWFPMMARLGNDGLVALDAALVWTAFARSISRPSTRNGLLLGALCGTGLLIKATMLPLMAGVLGFLLLATWREHRRDAQERRQSRQIAVAVAVAIATSGWWYLGKYLQTGNMVGSNDLAAVSNSGGLSAALVNPHFVWQYAKGWVFIASSFFWSSTWSFVSLPSLLLLPMVAGALALGYGHALWLRRSPGLIGWLPVTTLAVFCGGLGVHLVYFVVLNGGGTPGWYLHGMAPLFAAMVGTAFATLQERLWFRGLVTVVLTWSLFYLAAAAWLETLVFSGCGKKGHLLNRYEYDLASGCMSDGGRILEHLALLGSPRLAAGFGLVGVALLGVTLWKAIGRNPAAAAP